MFKNKKKKKKKNNHEFFFVTENRFYLEKKLVDSCPS